MSGRYSGWHRRSGAVDAPPQLRDVGKKLLAYLDNQQRLGGPPLLERRVELPDGSTVHARIENGVPSVRFGLGPKGGRRYRLQWLDGLVIRPTTGLNSQGQTPYPFGTAGYEQALYHHEVILHGGAPDAEPTNRAWYNEVYLPDEYEGKHYAPYFPNGLSNYANLDWRNSDETAIVQWAGPPTRYVGTRSHYGDYVFMRGLPIFDAYELDHDGLSGGISTDNPKVMGASVRGRYLQVAIRYRLNTYGNVGKIVFIAVPMKPARGHPQLPPEVPVYAYPEVVVDYDRIVVLGEVAIEADWYEFLVHPWLFNQDGTEARSLLHNNPAPDYEYRPLEVIATLPTVQDAREGNGTVGRSTIEHPAIIQASSGSVAVSDSEAIAFGAMVNGDVPSVLVPRANTSTPTPMLGKAWSSSSSKTTANLWAVWAVDYRDNVVVRAEARVPTESYTASGTASRTATGYGHALLVTSGLYPGWHVGADSGFSSVAAASSSSTLTQVVSGWRTDWIELIGEATTTITDSVDHNMVADRVALEDAVATATYETAHTEDGSETYYNVGYLDLRYRIILYQEVSKTLAHTFDRAAQPPESDKFLYFDDDTTTTRTYYHKVVLNAAGHTVDEVDITAPVESSSNSTVYTKPGGGGFPMISMALDGLPQFGSSSTSSTLRPSPYGADAFALYNAIPSSLGWQGDVQYRDHYFALFSRPLGSWVVKGPWLCYSHVSLCSEDGVFGDPDTADMFRTGLFNLETAARSPFDVRFNTFQLPDLAARVPAPAVRVHPIFALPPTAILTIFEPSP